MNREETKQYLKGQLESYLRGKGINTRKNFSCLNPEHADRNPSMGYNKKAENVKCFSCGADYDLFGIIGLDYGIPPKDFNGQYKKACELYGVTPGAEIEQPKQPKEQDTKPKISKEQIGSLIQQGIANVNQTDYFIKRGLSEETITRFKLGYVPNANKVILPIGDSYFMTRKVAEKEYTKLAGIEAPIFNAEYITRSGSSEVIFITEGIFDALSIEEAGGKAISLNGRETDKLFTLLDEHKPQHTFVLTLDNDAPGREAQAKIVDHMRGKNIAFKEANISNEYKDPSEALERDTEAFRGNIAGVITGIHAENEERKKAERVAYQNEHSAKSYINGFLDGIKSSIGTPAIPTGFNKLDKVLDGGFYEGLYCIGAISSLGKTTFILQIADQIAQQGQDVLIFSLEMSRFELMAKSISRLTFLQASDKRNAKTLRGILDGKRYSNYSEAEKDLIKKSIARYGEYAKHIYINQGVGDIGVTKIESITKKHIELTGNKPVIIIDYLQILAPHDPRSTDKQNTDKAVLELKRISRDYKIPVIAISSFNRQNYNQPVTMEAFKESGAIEYSSDILFGLQAKGAGGKEFDVNEAKRKDPREIELKVLKNRNGKTGDTISYEFYPMFNYFEE